MSEKGYIAIDRGIFDHSVFDPEPFTQREAWIWLVAEASWKACRRRIGKFIVDLKRGQVVASIRFLAQRWRWNRCRVERFLDRLKIETMIETHSETGISVITICNYDKYQSISSQDETREETQSETAARQQRDKVEPFNHLTKDTSSPKYAFESGIIRLNQRDFDRWRDAFPNLDLKAELIGLAPWAADQAKWFHALSGALAKRNREMAVRLTTARAVGSGRAVTSTGNPWPEGIT